MSDRPKAPSGGVRTEQRSGDDRRVGEDRRQSETNHDGSERRSGQERRLSQRREMRYGVLLSTVRTVASIEEWLEPRCQGDWTIILDEIDKDNLLKKRLRILFELESDKQAFIVGFRR
ncbi:MAG: hypothetical protein RBS99_15175 [Rhodospirillales bacterium]|jgi:hypothetical protein|nr:hypothetical protein [Rhodospirillales bacterium]